MKPSEKDTSIFVPGNEEIQHSDTATFNAAGISKVTPKSHPKIKALPYKNVVRKRPATIKHIKAIPTAPVSPTKVAGTFPNSGTVIRRSIGHYSVGDPIAYRFNPAGFHGKGSYEFLNKGKQSLVGVAKARFESSVKPLPGSSFNDDGNFVQANEDINADDFGDYNSEKDTSIFVPGNEEIHHSDTANFNAAGKTTKRRSRPARKKNPINLPRAAKIHKTAPQAQVIVANVSSEKPASPKIDQTKPIISPLAGQWVKLKDDYGKALLLDTNDDGSVKRKGNIQVHKGVGSRRINGEMVPMVATYLISTEPVVINGYTFYEVVRNSLFNATTKAFLQPGDWHEKSFPANGENKAFKRQYLIRPEGFELASENQYADEGDYNAEGSTPQKQNASSGEGETPIWAELLPLIGLGVGLLAAHKIGAKDGSKAVIGQYIAFGSCGMGLFSIPKFYVQMKNADKALSQFGKK